MTWYKECFSTKVDMKEIGIISRDILCGAEIDISETYSDSAAYSFMFGTKYFVRKGAKHYVLDVTMEKADEREKLWNTEFTITAPDRQIVGDEMLRVRAMVDNTTRIRRQQLERKMEATAEW